MIIHCVALLVCGKGSSLCMWIFRNFWYVCQRVHDKCLHVMNGIVLQDAALGSRFILFMWSGTMLTCLLSCAKHITQLAFSRKAATQIVNDTATNGQRSPCCISCSSALGRIFRGECYVQKMTSPELPGASPRRCPRSQRASAPGLPRQLRLPRLLAVWPLRIHFHAGPKILRGPPSLRLAA